MYNGGMRGGKMSTASIAAGRADLLSLQIIRGKKVSKMSSEGYTGTQSRTSFDKAVRDVLVVLEPGRGLNISQIARAASVNMRTAGKALDLLSELAESLEGKKITVHNTGPTKTYLMLERVGFDKLPQEFRDFYIKRVFPEATEEQRCLVGMLLNGACSPGKAVHLSKSRLLKKLSRLGRIEIVEKNQCYLTDLGIGVARGTLITYPDLAKSDDFVEEFFEPK